jgi:hypothetical protein
MTAVRFGSKADIRVRPRHVRFTPNSGYWNSVVECPLRAKSGLMHRNKNAAIRLPRRRPPEAVAEMSDRALLPFSD